MKTKKTMVVLIVLFLLMQVPVLNAFSIWGSYTVQRSESVDLGEWLLSEAQQTALEIEAYIEANLATDPDLEYIYSQSGNMSKISITIQDISNKGIVWDVYGYGTKTPTETLGFIQVVDRSTSGGIAVHDILPPPPGDVDPYVGYNYFLVNDVLNTLTNNQCGLRLNYGVEIITDQPIAGLTQVSFYASRGLSSAADTEIMEERPLTVSVSTDGSNWTTIGTVTPGTPIGTAYEFTHYVLDIPGNLLGEDLYVSMQYQGEGLSQGKSKYYSRAVIDELIFTTN